MFIKRILRTGITERLFEARKKLKIIRLYLISTKAGYFQKEKYFFLTFKNCIGNTYVGVIKMFSSKRDFKAILYF